MQYRSGTLNESKNLSAWATKEWPSNKQIDGSSCGIFVLMVSNKKMFFFLIDEH